jgi:hypothetical protein
MTIARAKKVNKKVADVFARLPTFFAPLPTFFAHLPANIAAHLRAQPVTQA